MKRIVVGACAAALCTLAAIGPTRSTAQDPRTLPMHFELHQEGTAANCGQRCSNWISATGAITADTPRDFETFAKRNNVRGLMLALDSDGGSVLGALALGRAVRGLQMTTTVGKTVELSAEGGDKRSQLLPRAYCESMCAFVLLAGVERRVPAEARVLVHQIWLGDRRDDPTAANYSAEDLVLVQRDIGRLAQYTVEMGGTIDLLGMALKIPPWEPMRLLSREELRGMKVVTADDGMEMSSGAASSRPALANGSRMAANDRSWSLTEITGRATLARKHPLTVEGDEIGSFELTLACGEASRNYAITYAEQRRTAEDGRSTQALTDVEISLSGKSIPLKIVSSGPGSRPAEFNSVASGRIPVELVKAFADARSRSLMIETTSGDTITTTRVGNAGLARGFMQLAANCGSQVRTRSTELRTGD
jgi:hypothetical protein